MSSRGRSLVNENQQKRYLVHPINASELISIPGQLRVSQPFRGHAQLGSEENAFCSRLASESLILPSAASSEAVSFSSAGEASPRA